MTVMVALPVVAPFPLLKVKVDEPLPGAATVCGLKLAVMPFGKPEMVSATDALKPPRTEVVILVVPLAVELTVTLDALRARVKPGTFTVRVYLSVIPPPLAKTVIE